MNNPTQSVYSMSDAEFKAALNEKTSPATVFQNAGRIYNFLTEIFSEDCTDSILREWAFEWYSEKNGGNYSYEDIYSKWLES